MYAVFLDYRYGTFFASVLLTDRLHEVFVEIFDCKSREAEFNHFVFREK